MIYGHEKTLGAIELFIINIGSATDTKNITKFMFQYFVFLKMLSHTTQDLTQRICIAIHKSKNNTRHKYNGSS